MFHTRSDSFDRAGVNRILERLEVECQAFAARTGANGSEVAIDWSTEARYPDQAWEIEVPLRRSRFGSTTEISELVADFHRTHQDVFAVSDPDSEVEMIGWNAEVRCRIAAREPGRMRAAKAAARLPARQVRFLANSLQTASVWDFHALPEHTVVAGPAIVESSFTSIVLDAGARAVRDHLGTLVIDVGA